MKTTITTHDGLKLRTQSNRRYVLFSSVHGNAGKYPPIYRTDDRYRGLAKYKLLRVRNHRMVLVDTVLGTIVKDDKYDEGET